MHACDEAPVCPCRRTQVTMTSLAIFVVALLCTMIYLPFVTGVARLEYPDTEDEFGSGPLPVDEIASWTTTILVFAALNAAIGLCIASICFCFYGDAGDSCALDGSEKRVAWCLLLSSVCGVCGVCMSAACVWSPSSEELACVTQSERSSVTHPKPRNPASKAPVTLQRQATTGRLNSDHV
jgi:formate hydrogenlyase subunit 3/multisubunit Na+/H+ antiporter MnhD subunit